jgi:cell division protein FtsL
MNRSSVALLIMTIVTALALWYVWQSWQVTDLSSQVIALRLERNALSAQKNHLRLEVIRVWSLENIERIASERLGMKKIPPKTLRLPPP